MSDQKPLERAKELIQEMDRNPDQIDKLGVITISHLFVEALETPSTKRTAKENASNRKAIVKPLSLYEEELQALTQFAKANFHGNESAAVRYILRRFFSDKQETPTP